MRLTLMRLPMCLLHRSVRRYRCLRKMSRRMRKRFEKPSLFVPELAEPLRAELERTGMQAATVCADLHAVSIAMRTEWQTSLQTPLVAATARADSPTRRPEAASVLPGASRPHA